MWTKPRKVIVFCIWNTKMCTSGKCYPRKVVVFYIWNTKMCTSGKCYLRMVIVLCIWNTKMCVQLIMKDLHRLWTWKVPRGYLNVPSKVLMLGTSNLFGDCDSKAYLTVKNTYCPDMVEKFECMGHYQKRLGCRLRKLKKNKRGLKSLTEPVIDKLQNYFGIALRSNTGSTVSGTND